MNSSIAHLSVKTILVGIGVSLINAGHKIAKELGYVYSIVLGSQQYYPKSGYLPADKFGIMPPFDVPSENFMACKIAIFYQHW